MAATSVNVCFRPVGAAVATSGASLEKIGQPDGYVLTRTIELAESLLARRGENSYITMAVAVAEDQRGWWHKLISSNEGDYVRPDVKQLAPARADETLLDGLPHSHAEQNIMSFVKTNDWKLKSIGSTRYICSECRIAIGRCGLRPIEPMKSKSETTKET